MTFRVESLAGVDDWFNSLIQVNRMLTMLALSDAGGRQLAASEVSPTIRAALEIRRKKQSSIIDDVFINTLPLRNRNGNIIGWLYVGSMPPATDYTVWLRLLAMAVVLTLLTACCLHRLIRRRLAVPLLACQEANARLALGELPPLQAYIVRDPATALHAALAARIHAARRRNASVLLKIGEVRAAHFDPIIRQTLDELAEPLALRAQQIDAAKAVRADTSRSPRASRRAWQASLVALLASDDDLALDDELERLATPQLALAVFRMDPAGSATVLRGSMH